MNLKLAKTFTFGVVMPEPEQDSRYWTLPMKGIEKAMNELSQQRIQIKYFFYDKYSHDFINRISKEIYHSPVDGLLIAPVVTKVFKKLVQDIPQSIPYVFFDSIIPNSEYTSFIGQDSYQSGILSGKMMHMLVKEKGTIVILRILPEDIHIDNRVKGFRAYYRICPGVVTKVYEIDGDKSREERNQIFGKMIAENKRLKGIFVTNANTHVVAEYLLSNPSPREIYVIGYDLVEDNITYLKAGGIDCLISQQSERQGYEGLYALYRYVVLKKTVPKNIMMQIDIVLPENIDYYHS
ncbi:MAG: sugar ABC transporter substrate-binding protein [Candidatus Aminicenantes bacterium]|nr:sugar ABC transporter substrate-binding protein [Candidatus Aminicenantes bacterium]